VQTQTPCQGLTVKSVIDNPPESDESSDDSLIAEKDFIVVCRVTHVRKMRGRLLKFSRLPADKSGLSGVASCEARA
jgi:hypothetical protein